jgi:hypothetical protein
MGRKHNRTGRSEGEGRFIKLPHALVKTQAHIALSMTARAVLVAVAERFNGSNNGTIAFAARDGERRGITKSACSRGLTELQSAGFLIKTQDACFSTKRLAATYELTWYQPSAGGAAKHTYKEIKARPDNGTDRTADGPVRQHTPERLAA